MNIKCIKDCQFSSWYNIYKEVTFKSEIIPLSEEFVQYLLADGVVLPKGCEAQMTQSSGHDWSGDDDDDDQVTQWETHPEDEAKRPDFPALNKAIESVIDKLGGKVFPKLNWSSPKDAAWISFNGSLQCTCPGDVYLLLKSSSFCTHDLVEPFLQCNDYVEGEKYPVTYELVLRKWYDIHPSTEFRVFVRNGQLIAISQRHQTTYYDFLNTDSEREDIIDDISDFYNQYIKDRNGDGSVVFDVYRKQKNIVYLVDLNPYGEVTDALLFTWDDLNDLLTTDQLPVLRLVDKAGVQVHPLKQYGVPVDILHLTTGADASKFIDLMNMKTQNPNDESSSDDENSGQRFIDNDT